GLPRCRSRRRGRAKSAVGRPVAREGRWSPRSLALAGWPARRAARIDLRLPAVPLLLGPSGVDLADRLPAAGPRRPAGLPQACPVHALDVDLRRADSLLADDRDALADERLQRVVVPEEPRRPGF